MVLRMEFDTFVGGRVTLEVKEFRDNLIYFLISEIKYFGF